MGSALEGEFLARSCRLMKDSELQTPCYLIDEAAIISNLEILRALKDDTGCRILLAQKAFSLYALYPLISRYIDGVCASGLYEARLGAEEMRAQTHVFCAAYSQKDIDELAKICSHIVFNSMAQAERFHERASAHGAKLGLRINPQCSTQEGHAIYDPCAKGSRLGITIKNVPQDLPDWIDGLHFHTLCEQNSDALEKTLDAVEEKFGKYLKRIRWINFGGGHHITKPGYDIERLKKCINKMADKYGLQVYLEPGEAVALNAGELITEVLDIVDNDGKIAILDASAACHMPDVIEMPYTPPLKDAGKPGEKKYNYTLAGATCLAGDVIGKYSFDVPLKVGDKLKFQDMAIYSFVKNNTFNGMPLPSLAIRGVDGKCRIVKSFGYEDFKSRLG